MSLFSIILPVVVISTSLAMAGALSTNASTACTTSSQAVQCLTCPVGSKVNTAADGCTQCSTFCLECNATDCISCESTYSLQNGICTRCDTGVPWCNQCTFGATGVSDCTSCVTGYSFVQGQCQVIECPANCDTCEMSEDGVKCTACSEGYIINTDVSSNLQCLSCPSACTNCHTYLGIRLCTECVPGYSVFEGHCKACRAGCDQCSFGARLADVSCLQCFQGYGLHEGSATCGACTDPNSMCTFDSTRQEIVSACAEGFVQSAVDVCTFRGCLTGSAADPNGVCTACPDKCISCVYHTGDTHCLICDTGYIIEQLRSRQICQACVANCADCESRTNCSQCAAGYTRTTAGSCQACPSRCVECYYDDTFRHTQCLDCEAGSLEVIGICLECPTGCDRCFRTDTGLKCFSTACGKGFKYDVITASCTACPFACTTCLGSADALQCDVCDSSYYLVPEVVPYCAACQENCVTCAFIDVRGEAVCTLCDDKFTLHSSGVCKACPAYCLSCVEDVSTGDISCDSCDDGFERTRGCIECPAGCSACDVVDGIRICSECFSGYVMDAARSSCIACGGMIPNCVSCYGSTVHAVCEECYHGYTLLDGLECAEESCQALGLPDCTTCGYKACGECQDGYKYDQTDRTCKPACYQCTGDDGAAYNKDCGSHGSEKEYDLEICQEGSCWVHLMYEDEEVRYRRGCYSDTCSDAYKLRVCTRYKTDDEEADEQKMECSRCCDTAGCNGFTLSRINLSLAHKTIYHISSTLTIAILAQLTKLYLISVQP